MNNGLYNGLNQGRKPGRIAGLEFGRFYGMGNTDGFPYRGYQIETIQWLNILPQRPERQIILAVDEFIRQCKIDLNWTLLDRFWLFAQDIQINAKYSICNPTSAVYTEQSSPPWTKYRGYAGNGSGYIDSNFNPSTGNYNYTADNDCHGNYVTNNASSSGTFVGLMGSTDGNYNKIIANDGGTCYHLNNAANGSHLTYSTSNTIGLHVTVRTSHTTIKGYLAGVLKINGSQTSTGLENRTFFILGVNNGGLTQAGVFNQAFAFAGSGNMDQVKFYKATERLRQRIGF